jgi:hypothetical protein
VLVVAVPTFFALFAPRRTPLLARESFWLGIAINEHPFYPMVWLAAATILATPHCRWRSRVPGGSS